MTTLTRHAESWAVRRVFEAWSITVPTTLAETFVADDGYWHAYADDRSVSLTSVVLAEEGRPVPATAIAEQAFRILSEGIPVEECPEGMTGRAVIIDLEQPARASRALSGLIATDGRLLLVTVTSDDEAWSRRVWSSICWHPMADQVQGLRDAVRVVNRPGPPERQRRRRRR